MESGDSSSRNRKRPSVWSRSASVSRIASIGFSRVWRRGCHLEWISCRRRSGETFTNTHWCPFALRATLLWVRISISPPRTPSHWRHPQFHCGTPPPAADPNNCTTIDWLIDREDHRHRLKRKMTLRKKSVSPRASESSKPFFHPGAHL